MDIYSVGQGVPQDYKEAVKWFRLAAEQGFANAQYNLGVTYREGQGVAKDFDEAFKWFKLSAEQGVVLAQYNLGLFMSVARAFFKTIRWRICDTILGPLMGPNLVALTGTI